MQSTLHVAAIMDGNGRWALARGLPRAAGHYAGVEAARRIVEAAPDLGISILTLFAFSSDNWRRPPAEVDILMKLMERYLDRETSRCIAEGVRIEIIGRRDRLAPRLADAIAQAEAATRSGRRLHMRIAVDYSGRDSILHAAGGAIGSAGALSRESLDLALGPPVDLLIRTGGEQRLSDFLLWESAYAELVFSRRMWPDFTPSELESAVREFHSRQRRFGAVPEPPPAGHNGNGRRHHAWLE
jgi:undecaprenyl diphosphate synthase